jgi:hypothetical protein
MDASKTKEELELLKNEYFLRCIYFIAIFHAVKEKYGRNNDYWRCLQIFNTPV